MTYNEALETVARDTARKQFAADMALIASTMYSVDWTDIYSDSVGRYASYDRDAVAAVADRLSLNARYSVEFHCHALDIARARVNAFQF